MGLLTVYSNEYIILVGPSGARKGTAMDPGYELLNEIGIKMSFEATTREALIRSLSKTTNTSTDAAGNLTMHSSLTIFSKELTVFLGYSNLQLMDNLCDWYDCARRWGYETISRDKNEIHGVWVNLIGATTPELLQSSMPKNLVGSGLTARMILVYAPKKGKVVYFPFLTAEQKEIGKKLKEDLEQIAMMSGEFKMTEKFIEGYINWRDRHEANPAMALDIRFSYYNERRPAHILKLCMILSASSSDEMIVDIVHLQRAEELLTAAERKMPRAFAGVGKSKHGDALIRIWTLLAARGIIKKSEIMTMFHYDLDAREMEGVLETLHVMKVIEFGMDNGEPIVVYKRHAKVEDTYGI